MQGMVAEKRSRGKPSHRWEKDIRYIRQQVEWPRTGTDFARTCVQRRPEEDMLSEDDAEPVYD